MSFHKSAQDIELDGTILKANLANVEGELVEAELDLNEILGNNDGTFEWGGSGFGGSADDVEFSLEGEDEDEQVPVLRANLHNADGEGVAADVNLAERIHNSDGSFYFE